MKKPATFDWKSISAGAFFVAVGLLYGNTALRTLPFGSTRDMGPGYFPILLSGLLAVLGVAILARGLLAGRDGRLGVVPWRAIAMLMLAIVVFATLLHPFGLFPTVALTAATAAMSVKHMKPMKVLAISLAIAVFCTLVFGYGVKLPIPILGPLLGGQT